MFRMRFVMFVGPGEVRPDRVGGVDVVDDAVRVGERVVAPTLAPRHILSSSSPALPGQRTGRDSRRYFQFIAVLSGPHCLS